MDAPPKEAPTINSVVAFIIGLAIIILASILNAAGLNLTKLDHVRTSAIPKSARRKDWMRPLWLLGMLLYILSQLIGSTLALEYMRAEYVAPLGSTSLVFNFLFARFLVGTPVTSTDIYGTIVVILGVIGIVAFGSINSGLTSKTDVEHLTYLWRRGGWLGFFFSMAFALIAVLIFTSRLDAVLVARGDLGAVPFSGISLGTPNSSGLMNTDNPRKEVSVFGRVVAVFRGIGAAWGTFIRWLTARLEVWTATQDDKQIAWTLGIGWACCGGGLAGGCLVFAKATVKLLSGSLSKQNPGNQFGHAAPIFMIILLAATAVMQIICLNRGLRVYDSTLVVPVFYGVYTATGFLDSLIFNDEVDAYKSWTLFLIFASILILISGVVLLTHKKPEPVKSDATATAKQAKQKNKKRRAAGDETIPEGENATLWTVGEDGDGDSEGGLTDDGEGDDDIDHHQHPLQHKYQPKSTPSSDTAEGGSKGKGRGQVRKDEGEEGIGLINAEDEEGQEDPSRYRANPHLSSRSRLDPRDPFRDDVGQPEEFGEWEVAGKR